MKIPATHRWMRLTVWALRVIIGLTFVISGGAKMVDPYGFIYKIDQYLAVWGITFATDGLVLLAAVAISMYEFLAGFALLTGSFRRTSAPSLLLLMATMLPLSIYIAIADPVDDCGCFGDMLVISNTATCLKNIAITASLLYLAVCSPKVRGIFAPSVQWMQMAVAFAYIGLLGIIGYHEQPLLDFRPYGVGTILNGSDAETDPVFIYEKDGERRNFTMDELPDDTWTFIDREESGDTGFGNSLVLLDGNGDDVTCDAITADGEQLLLLIPDMSDLDISWSYTINELNRYITDRGGSMIAAVHADSLERENWIDLSMADYPVCYAEDTAIKSVARGRMAMVYLKDGEIQWKRTVSSINLDKLASNHSLEVYDTDGPERFRRLTAIFAGLELLILMTGFGAVRLHGAIHRRPKQVN